VSDICVSKVPYLQTDRHNNGKLTFSDSKERIYISISLDRFICRHHGYWECTGPVGVLLAQLAELFIYKLIKCLFVCVCV